MKRKISPEFAQLIQRFFEDYLPGLRGMSTHTIHSYRDATVLFLRFIARETGRGIETLQITDLTADRVESFLMSLDRERHNGITTRNTRLAVQDLRLESPYQVRLRGKGNKVRVCPLWPATVKCLRAHLEQQSSTPDKLDNARLFSNRTGAPLTRFGVGYLLQKYVAVAAERVATLRGKSLHPHCLRHTTALSLLKSGVDFATISQWLGHSTLNVTMRYARSDIDLKRAALSQVFPDAIAPPKAGKLRIDGAELTNWLRSL